MQIDISLKNVSKSFKIYHEKRDSIFESIIGSFRKRQYYEKLTVLDNVSFDVKKGEMFGIIGKNGIGKTTLLRLISGIYKPDSGKIEINGTVIPFLGLGAGFQPEMTARDNVILYGKLLGFSTKEILEKLDKIMEFAELEKFADTKLKHFSSGMYARLSFSTGIQVNPDIMLMDEILAVGDLRFQKKSYETFLSFKKKEKTIILVTHDMKVIAENCDRAMFLDNSKIQLIGRPKEVIDAYKNSLSDQKYS